MDLKRSVLVGAVALSLAVGAAGCGKVGEKIAEKATGCEDIDASGDEVGAKCDGHDVSVDGDGNVKSTDAEGNEIDISADGKASLPEGWPADLAPPEGTKIISANSTTTPARSLSVVAGLDGDLQEVFEAMKTQLTEAGYTIDTENVADVNGSASATISATGDQFQASVLLGEAVDGQYGNLSITYSLTEVTA